MIAICYNIVRLISTPILVLTWFKTQNVINALTIPFCFVVLDKLYCNLYDDLYIS